MYHHIILKGIFLITLFNVISANPITDDCYTNCDATDKVPVCVFDKSLTCFINFPSVCVMENIKCLFEKDFMTFDAEYCNLEGFQCEDKSWPKLQSPPLENMDSYFYNENPQDSVEIVFKHDNDVSSVEDNYNNDHDDKNPYYMVDGESNDLDNDVNSHDNEAKE